MTNLEINTDQMRKRSQELVDLINVYSNLVQGLYIRFDNMPGNTEEWIGQASSNFVKTINKNDRPQLNELSKNLLEYANSLNNLADRIDAEVGRNKIQ